MLFRARNKSYAPIAIIVFKLQRHPSQYCLRDGATTHAQCPSLLRLGKHILPGELSSGSFNLPSVTHSHRTCVRRASQYPCVRTVYDGQLLDLFSSHFTLFKQSPPGF